MANKYLDGNSLLATKKCLDKGYYHLGAFDTVDTSNPVYDVINRNTLILKAEELYWQYSSATNRYYSVRDDVKPVSSDNVVANIVSNKYVATDANTNQTLTESIAVDVVGEILVKSSSTPKGIIQVELTDNLKYTEKVIKNQPLNTLDQQGSEFVRKEWEKTQQLWDEEWEAGGIDANGQPYTDSTRIRSKNYCKCKGSSKLFCSISTANNPYLFIFFYDSGFNFIRYDSVANVPVNVPSNAVYFKISPSAEYGATYNHDIMINEGDHAYPYQPYNGKIIHEKDIAVVELSSSSGTLTDEQFNYLLNNENALIKRSGRYYRRYLKDSSSINFVSITQVINQTTNMDLYMPKVVITLANKNYSFSADNNFYYSKDQADSKFAKEDEMAEIKSLVYDNQVPAVANLPVPYATNYALPSQISGDKIIMSAGMDMTKVKGRSYVVNQQLLWDTQTITSDTGLTITVNDGVYHVQGTVSQAGNIELSGLTPNYHSGHYYLLLGMAGNIGEIDFNRFIGTQLTDNGDGAIAQATSDGGSGDPFRLRVYESAVGKTYDFYLRKPICPDLTQWFGSNDAIPADLLADPSLFTKKYWKGELPYDTGHIEDSKPIKVVSVGFNKWDEEWENGGISGVNGSNEANANYFRSKNYIKVIPNKDYYFKGLGTHYLFYYDINKSFISRSSQYFVDDVRTIPQGVYYIRFIKYGTTYNNGICINISDPLLNGKYLPYQKNEYPIIPIQTATIEIGTTSWNTSGTMSNTFFCGLPNIKHSDNVIASLSNAQYQRYYSTTDLENAESGYYITNNGGLYVKDTNYATAVAFVNANRGTTITYEVANQPYKPLRSAGSVQDDNEEVKVGVVDLGSLNYDYTDASGGFQFVINGFVAKDNYVNTKQNLLCAEYETVDSVTYFNSPTLDKVITAFIYEGNTILRIRDTYYTNAASLKTALSGVILNYELATPTEQSPSYTLPENIEIQKGGTIEIEYDDDYSAPCDIDFEVAVSKVLEE